MKKKTPMPGPIPPPPPLERLKRGNLRYVNDNMKRANQDQKRRDYFLKKAPNGDLLNPQRPFAIILSCADSRVTPELIFDTGIGELFVVRVAGNIANPASIASIEYAVAVLGVKLIVVLGHQDCGAVKAAMKRDSVSYNLDQLLAYIHPALGDSTPKDSASPIIKKNAELTAKTLIAQSTIIRCVSDLEIVPAFYHLSGKVSFFEKSWKSNSPTEA